MAPPLNFGVSPAGRLGRVGVVTMANFVPRKPAMAVGHAAVRLCCCSVVCVSSKPTSSIYWFGDCNHCQRFARFAGLELVEPEMLSWRSAG